MSDAKDSRPIPNPKDGVPPELIDELHQANQKFSEARKHAEQAIDAASESLGRRGETARELREAEEAVEKADQKIRPEFKKTQA